MHSSIASSSLPSRLVARPVACLLVAAWCTTAALPAAQAQAVIDLRPGGSNQRLPATLPPSEQKTANSAYQEASRLARAGERERALQVAEAALRNSPRDAQLRFLRGVLLAENGRRGDAVDAFESLVADFPELPEPYNNLAVLHAAAGDLDKARAALESAIRTLPNYALAHENLGDVYLRMAARSYEFALREAPTSRSAQDKLALARELVQRVTPPPAAAAPAAAGPARTAPAEPAR